MLMRTIIMAMAGLLIAGGTAAQPRNHEASLTITQRALVVQCLDGVSIPGGRRSWTVVAPVTLAVTMRNQPRPGMAPAGDASTGTAVVRFTPEPGHRYEVEVRADADSFSRRVWTAGAWTPVVRDRTTETIVSSPAEWVASPPCGVAR